jgi:hypothetical protein
MPLIPSEVTSQDVTPAAPTIHKVVIKPDYVATVLAQIDPSAPAGRKASQINTAIDGKTGQITFFIHYAPAPAIAS